jgi:hypothetical protein
MIKEKWGLGQILPIRNITAELAGKIFELYPVPSPSDI